MKTMKVRRVGNSNVVSLPRELEDLGFTEGAEVVVVPTHSGEVMLLPAARVDIYLDRLAERVVEENREALAILDAHDRAGESMSEAHELQRM